MAAIRAAATSAALSRLQWIKSLGLTFGGKREINTALGYNASLTASDYRERYERGGVAGRVVDCLPTATWRTGGMLIETEDPDKTTAFEAAWIELEKRLRIWSVFQKVDTLSLLNEYACLYLGFKDGTPGVPLKKQQPGSLIYLATFSQEEAKIESYEDNPKDPRYGLPKTYQLHRRVTSPAGVSALAEYATSVHWSRVIHVAHGALDNDVFGRPILKRPWNRLDDLEKVTGGGAEAFWLRANQGLNLNMDKDVEFTDEELAKLGAQADEYEHNQRRIMRTRGVTVETLGSDVADFSGPADAILTQIAACIGIPKRILMGSESGQLASGQDRTNWDTMVGDRRTGYAGPMIVMPFADRLIEFGVLPAPGKDGYQVMWPPAQTLTDTERMELAGKAAEVNAKSKTVVIFQPNELREMAGYDAMDELADLPAVQEPPDEEEQTEELVAALRKGGVVNIAVTK